MNTAEEVSAGISEIKGIVAQIKNLNENVSDNCVIGAILSALPESFEIFRMVWKNSAEQSLDDLVSKVMAEATEQVAKNAIESKALNVKRKDNSKKKKGTVNKDQCRYCKV